MGGAEMMLYRQLAACDREHFEPTVVCLMNRDVLGERIEATGIPVHVLGMRRGQPAVRALLKLAGMIRKLQPDIIQGWLPHANLAIAVGKILARHKSAVLWTIHQSLDDIKNEKKSTALVIRLCKLFSKQVTKIIYCSKASARHHEAMGYARSRTVVIPNGFDCDIFKPSEQARKMLRGLLGLPGDTFIIGLIARYHPMKDHENFFRAASELIKTHGEVHFVLAGSEVRLENPFFNALMQAHELHSHVHLLGERHDIHTITAGLDVASSSSAYGEAFPLVLGEAMACGVPCAVTDVGDSAWIVGDTGKVISPREPAALACAWRELIDMDYDARKALGERARRRVMENFSIKAVMLRYETLYREIATC
jgi:glycosyltransferase involved in cell wall biosynthesis